MKRNVFSLLLIVSIVFVCCKKTESEPDAPSVIEDAHKEIRNEYKIELSRTIERVCPGVDTSFLFFSGRKSGKIWVRGYKKADKSRIFDFVSESLPDTIVKISKGYDENETINIKRFVVGSPIISGNFCAFILWGIQSTNDLDLESLSARYISYIYLFKEDKLITNFAYKNNLKSIRLWYENGIYTEIDPIKSSSDNFDSHTFYSSNGDSLFTIKSVLGDIDYQNIISVDEFIDFVWDENRLCFVKRNLHETTNIWQSNPLSKMSRDIRKDRFIINKKENNWIYTFFCTQ